MAVEGPLKALSLLGKDCVSCRSSPCSPCLPWATRHAWCMCTLLPYPTPLPYSPTTLDHPTRLARVCVWHVYAGSSSEVPCE